MPVGAAGVEFHRLIKQPGQESLRVKALPADAASGSRHRCDLA
jgi:hypothetical protein